MRAQPIVAAAGRAVGDDRPGISPYAVVGTHFEPYLTVLCVAFLAGIFGAELLTPTAVVSVLGTLPVILAAWTMSGGFAGIVFAAALVELSGSLVLEPASRLTLVLVGLAAVALAILTRVYARSLADLVANLQTRPSVQPSTGVVAWGTSITFEGCPRALTRREQEVAYLAARGFTAAEIGERLHIGHRTVETHLASVYGKLMIRSRRELIRMAAAPPKPSI
ncbi:MAG TPA: helix-turn-helix transcriptional regulator [Candidatus Dormibacteraeota bacterium]